MEVKFSRDQIRFLVNKVASVVGLVSGMVPVTIVLIKVLKSGFINSEIPEIYLYILVSFLYFLAYIINYLPFIDKVEYIGGDMLFVLFQLGLASLTVAVVTVPLYVTARYIDRITCK